MPLVDQPVEEVRLWGEPQERHVANLAAALSKAQAAFPQIPRDKTVRVETRTGGSYTFKYAPLDTILAAVRGPLAANGLALSQLLDGNDLVTLLLHDSGESLEGRMPLPRTPGDSIQVLGSAITYLRRYAIQALLGIAAEEDDDGNRAVGNKIHSDEPEPKLEQTDDGSLIGNVAEGKAPADLQLRYEPDGRAYTGFALTQGRKRLQVVAVSPLAEALHPFLAGLVGQRVTCYGTVEMVPWFKDGRKMPEYQRLQLDRIVTADWTLPSAVAPGQVAAFDEPSEAEKAAILAAEQAEAGL